MTGASPWGALLLDPAPDEARRLLADELARPAYQEPLLQRLLDQLADLVRTAAVGGSGLGRAAAVGVLLVVLGLAVLALSRLRRGASAAPTPSAVFGGARLGAREHRAAGRAAYDAGRWDEAVVEALRALAAGLFDRGLVAEQHGLTAHEVVQDAAARFGQHAAELTALGRTFDEVRYGDRHVGEQDARAALGLEERLAAATPTSPTAGPLAAVPR